MRWPVPGDSLMANATLSQDWRTESAGSGRVSSSMSELSSARNSAIGKGRPLRTRLTFIDLRFESEATGVSIQNTADETDERIGGVRFLEEGDLIVLDTVPKNRVWRVPRQEGHSQPWVSRHQRLRQFPSAHPRHHHIGQDQIKSRWHAVASCQGRSARFG